MAMSEAATVRLMLPLVNVEKSRVSEAKDSATDFPMGPDNKPPDAHNRNKHQVVDNEFHLGNVHLNLCVLRREGGVLG